MKATRTISSEGYNNFPLSRPLIKKWLKAVESLYSKVKQLHCYAKICKRVEINYKRLKKILNNRKRNCASLLLVIAVVHKQTLQPSCKNSFRF